MGEDCGAGGGGGGYELKEDKKIKKPGENKNTKDRTETEDVQKNRLLDTAGEGECGTN